MSDREDYLRDLFRAAGRRLTSQRRLIVEVLDGSSAHLDADGLYDQVRLHDPDISLATIYRTLAVLKEMGLVEEHRLGEEHGHYELVHDHPHYHFTCLDCGKVTEFDTPLVAQIRRELSEREGLQVTCAHLHLSGYCAQCRAQRELGGQLNDERRIERTSGGSVARFIGRVGK